MVERQRSQYSASRFNYSLFLSFVIIAGLALIVAPGYATILPIGSLDGSNFMKQVSTFASSENSNQKEQAIVEDNCFSGVTFDITGPDKPREILNDYLDHYTKITFSHKLSTSQDFAPLSIKINYKKDTAFKTIDTNEEYSLNVNKASVEITANTVFGIFYGVQHVSEMVIFHFDLECYSFTKDPKVTLIDRFAPAVKHRELLIDTGRHFLPVNVIERVLYSMAYARLNVLHWHIGDKQSFPLCLKSVPNLCDYAFSSHERYTVGDAKYIVAKANSLGIRVIPEIDTPGHATPLCSANNLCSGKEEACKKLFDVSNEKTFQVIETLFKEITDIFPDDYIHTGADEVDFDCWDTNAAIVNWMSSKKMTSKDAYGYFVTRVHNIIFALGKKPISWDEVYEHFGEGSPFKKSKVVLDKRVTIQLWRNKVKPLQILRSQHPLIFSKAFPQGWYLDHTNKNWAMMYFTQPFKTILKPYKETLLGGGGEMWGEKVDTSDLFSTVWPRAAAISKYLWDGGYPDDKPLVEKKLKQFRCLLISRGIGAAPLSNPNARSPPSGPGSCFV